MDSAHTDESEDTSESEDSEADERCEECEELLATEHGVDGRDDGGEDASETGGGTSQLPSSLSPLTSDAGSGPKSAACSGVRYSVRTLAKE